MDFNQGFLDTIADDTIDSILGSDKKIDDVYVCGFLFHMNGLNNLEVALIQKNRPVWQQGRLNGIGGHVEDGESPRAAMVREFEEEAGVRVTDWRCFLVLRHRKSLVYMFTSTAPNRLPIYSPTDEKVDYWLVSLIGSYYTIDNLKWIIPLAHSKSREVVLVADDSPLPTTVQVAGKR